MPEFTNDIIDLDELNRKVEANRQKKLRRKRSFRLKVMFLQFTSLFLSLVSFILCRSYVIPVWLGSIVCLVCALCSAYLTGYSAGCEDAVV